MNSRASDPRLQGLYGITDSQLMPNLNSMLFQVEAALRGGCGIIQYRDKSTGAKQRQQQAAALLDLCHQYDSLLLINDDIELAQAISADGVHLGQGDGNHADTRNILGPNAIIGITCHDDLQLAEQACSYDADYVAFGAFFASKTKPNAKPAPMHLLHDAKQNLPVPVVAIGGITVDNAHQIINAGADMLAVVHSLFSAEDITARAQSFQQLFR
ncbi:thiamine phosphate synthase [Aliamphritea ceti]|uniref:thiamine phosphate synthase n=1 Tax=Aliamphritea ceti TaxID=1524258 RepID=UPI0021C35317|nr:thiamine phosphate synthase [Aliamphritea ceti]